jgi:transposase
MSHIRGQGRTQATLFPEVLDDLIEEEAQVRVIDAFVSQLDLVGLRFGRAVAARTGRPGYDPGDLLKLYVYGYLNQVRSSRKLEREAGRNVELLWLLNRLRPDFKTIADFRRDNAKAIVGACRAFTLFCREAGLFGAQLVAIDGSKFQAVASRKQVWTKKRVEQVRAAIDRRIVEYLSDLDSRDGEESVSAQESAEGTRAALKALQEQRDRLQGIAQELETASQHVVTEPEAKLMRTAHEGHQVAYNVQTAVDAKHSLIVAFEVTNEGNDRQQLAPMAKLVKEVLEVEALTVVADTGYHNGEQGKECETQQITALVSAPRMSNGEHFNKERFSYDADTDSYRCPAGETLRRFKTDEQKKAHYYRTQACSGCALRAHCTDAQQRTVMRSFFEAWGQRMDQRAKDHPELMKRRKAIVEHPFAGLKHLMGRARFLVRGTKKVAAEMALSVWGYNLKRTIKILGARELLQRWPSAAHLRRFIHRLLRRIWDFSSPVTAY